MLIVCTIPEIEYLQSWKRLYGLNSLQDWEWEKEPIFDIKNRIGNADSKIEHIIVDDAFVKSW